MDTQFIANNPFRILGVTTNATARQITQAEGRIKAFAKVGKPCDFPNDMLLLLAPVERDEATVAQARNAIAMPEERLKRAFFWFASTTPVHKQAMDALAQGEVAEAKQFLAGDGDDVISRYNLGVVHFIEGDLNGGAGQQLAVLRDEKACREFVATVTGGNYEAPPEQVVRLYMAQLSEHVDKQELASLTGSDELTDEETSFLSHDNVSRLVAQINDDVNRAKATDAGNPNAKLEAARRLVDETVPVLEALREEMGDDDAQCALLADRLAEAILSTAIDYYNHSYDAHCVTIALPLYQRSAQVAVGQFQQERCNKEIGILQKMLLERALDERTAPQPWLGYVSAIKQQKALLESYGITPEAIATFVGNCKSILARMRQVPGGDDNYYVAVSSHVVHYAVNHLVGFVNEEQNRISSLRLTSEINAYRRLLNYAVDIMTRIYEFEMNDYVTEYYNQNTNALNKMVTDVNQAQSPGDNSGCGSGCMTYGWIFAVLALIRILLRACS